MCIRDRSGCIGRRASLAQAGISKDRRELALAESKLQSHLILQERRSPRTESIRFPRSTVGLVAHHLAPPPWSARLFPTTAPLAAGWPVARPRLHPASRRAVQSAPAITSPVPPRGWLPSKPPRCESQPDVLGDSRRIPPPVSYTHLRAHETPEHLVCR